MSTALSGARRLSWFELSARSRITALLYRDKDRYEDLAEMAAIPELAESWRRLAARRVETRATESWTSRLSGPG